MTSKLSPEAAAAASAAVVAKYTAKAWHAVPEGATDRRASSAAHISLLGFVPEYNGATYVWLDIHPTWTAELPVYQWMEDEPGSDRKAGHVEAIPKDWVGNRAKDQLPRVVFILTGTVTQNITTARLWYGQRDISAHWMSGQHHQAVGAYEEYATVYEQQDLGKDAPLIRAVAHHSASVGCCLTYEEAHFVGDFPVGHIFGKPGKDEVTPLWSNERAKAHGATQQPDGTWA